MRLRHVSTRSLVWGLSLASVFAARAEVRDIDADVRVGCPPAFFADIFFDLRSLKDVSKLTADEWKAHMASLRTESKVTTASAKADDFIAGIQKRGELAEQAFKQKYSGSEAPGSARPNVTLSARDVAPDGMDNINYSIYDLSVRPIAKSEAIQVNVGGKGEFLERVEDSYENSSAKARYRWHLSIPKQASARDALPTTATRAKLAEQGHDTNYVKVEWKVRDPKDSRIVHKYSNVMSETDVLLLRRNPDAATREAIVQNGLALTSRGKPVNDPEVLRNLVERKGLVDDLVHKEKGRLPQDEVAVAYKRKAYVVTLKDGQTLQITVDADIHGTDLKSKRSVAYPEDARVIELKVPVDLANRYLHDREGLVRDGYGDYVDIQQSFNDVTGMTGFTRDRGKFYHVMGMMRTKTASSASAPAK